MAVGVAIRVSVRCVSVGMAIRQVDDFRLRLLVTAGVLRIEQGHSDLCQPDRTAVSRTREDDILHAAAAKALGGLLAKHPTDGVT